MTWYAHPILEWVSRIARRISAWVLNLFNIFNVFRQQQPSPLSEVVRDTQIETRLTHPILEKVMRFARRTSAMPGVAAGAQMTHGLDSDLELYHEKNPQFTPTPQCLGLYENEGHVCQYCHHDYYLHITQIKDLEYITQWPCCFSFR